MPSPRRLAAPALALLAGLAGLAGCRVPAEPGVGSTGGGPSPSGAPAGTAPAALARIEAGVDLDGQLVGPLARGQAATLAIVFASWCVHCHDEMHVLAAFRARHPEVRVLGINYKGHEEYDNRGSSRAVREFVAELAPWLRVVPADDAMFASLGSPPKVPTIYIFDRDGGLVRSFDRRRDPIPTLDDLEAVSLPPASAASARQ